LKRIIFLKKLRFSEINSLGNEGGCIALGGIILFSPPKVYNSFGVNMANYPTVGFRM
jgi:hypothetical protein